MEREGSFPYSQEPPPPHWTLPWARWIHSTSSHQISRSILILPIQSRLSLFSLINFVLVSYHFNACYMSRPSHPPHCRTTITKCLRLTWVFGSSGVYDVSAETTSHVSRPQHHPSPFENLLTNTHNLLPTIVGYGSVSVYSIQDRKGLHIKKTAMWF